MPSIWESAYPIKCLQNLMQKFIPKSLSFRIIIANCLIQFEPGYLEEPNSHF